MFRGLVLSFAQAFYHNCYFPKLFMEVLHFFSNLKNDLEVEKNIFLAQSQNTVGKKSAHELIIDKTL